ncbi:MAG: hypothetical protein S4CHLAM20_14410 [Chlamydiia bacterium]|nr:hypothetical protein [Chlamydiia bacterium]
MKYFNLCILCFVFAFSKPKVLHITFHPSGCPGEIKALSKHFDFDLTTWIIPNQKYGDLDPSSYPMDNYMMTHEKADRIFKKHKETFESFDLIITSDVAPLSRIFLQNNWQKPLIVWVCNRFDLCVIKRKHKIFPDPEYYELFENAKNFDNIAIIGYTNYERVHAFKNKNITSIKETIPPTGLNEDFSSKKAIKKRLDKENRFFVRRYINEKNYGILQKLEKINIQYYCGPYAGSQDLKDFKGMIHIPIVMSNFFLWENLKQGIIHFIPSKKFYKELYETKAIQFWDWTKAGSWWSFIPTDEIFENSDWYNDKLAPYIVYFDSMEHLKQLTEEIDFEAKRKDIKAFHKRHVDYCLSKWDEVFKRLL